MLDEDEIARQLDAVDAAEEANTALMAKTGELELTPGEMKFVFDEFDKRRMKRKHITDRMNAIVTGAGRCVPPGLGDTCREAEGELLRGPQRDVQTDPRPPAMDDVMTGGALHFSMGRSVQRPSSGGDRELPSVHR